MKKIFLMILVSLVLTISVKADLMYYTFEGEVISGSMDAVEDGKALKYIFGIDFNEPAILDYLDQSLNDQVQTDFQQRGFFSIHFFYCEFITGDLFLTSAEENEYDIKWGMDVVFSDTRYGDEQHCLIGGDRNHYVTVSSDALQVNLWSENMTFNGSEEVYHSSTGSKEFIGSKLKLISITSSVNVPEPTLFSLIFCIIPFYAILRFKNWMQHRNYK